jgi:DNA-directed RNA polymerase sigma subunit (sigma70/sigma32)
MMRRMNTAKKANVGLDDAYHALQVAARKRRRAAFKYWQTGKTFTQVGEAFGVSRQRACEMVRRGESEFAPEYL